MDGATPLVQKNDMAEDIHFASSSLQLPCSTWATQKIVRRRRHGGNAAKTYRKEGPGNTSSVNVSESRRAFLQCVLMQSP